MKASAYLTKLGDGAGLTRFEPDFLEPTGAAEPALPGSVLDAEGRVVVDRLIAFLDSEESLRRFRPLVALTGRDLARSECGSLFGYADPDRRICVVSTARLGQPCEQLRARLENVIRHEIGHLRGATHCRRRGCLMRPAKIPEDLDERNPLPCSRCSRRAVEAGTILRRAAALLFFLSALATMNLAASLLKPGPKAPFALAAEAPKRPAGNAESPRVLSFQGRPLEYTAALIDPAKAPAELNRLFRLIDPPPLTVAASGDGEAVIFSGESELFRVRHDRPLEEAGKLAGRLNELLEAKGAGSSLCAECHRKRKPEVLEAAKGRKWGIGPF